MSSSKLVLVVEDSDRQSLINQPSIITISLWQDEIPYSDFESNPNTVLAVTLRGGHHAFLGNNPHGPNWCDHLAVQWFETILRSKAVKPSLTEEELAAVATEAEAAEEKTLPTTMREGEFDLVPSPVEIQEKSDRYTRILSHSRAVLLVVLWPMFGYQLFKFVQSTRLKESRHFFAGVSTAFILVGLYRFWSRKYGPKMNL